MFRIAAFDVHHMGDEAQTLLGWKTDTLVQPTRPNEILR